MAGLFAWAADVVGAVPQDGDDESETPAPPLLNFQQIHDLSTLDAKAAALQRSVDVLRKRVGAASQSFAERMPHVLADSVAAQAALDLEVQAHNTTRSQIQARQVSLRAENEAYAKALIVIREETKEKNRDLQDLNSSLEELEGKHRVLGSELEKLRVALSEKDGLAFQEREETAAGAADRELYSRGELKKLRAEVEEWEAKTMKIEKALFTAQQCAQCRPSPAQRERELERMLVNLTDQLGTKQAQAETVSNERTALEIRLHQLSEAYNRVLSPGNLDGKLKRNKIGQSSSIHAIREESKSRAWSGRQRTPKAVGENVANVARRMDAFSLRAGSHLLRNKLLRSFTVAYILALHLAAFIMVTRRMHRQFQPAIREFP